MSAEGKRRLYRAKLSMSQAWHTALFSMIGTNKPRKFPSLEKVLNALDPKRRVIATPEQMMKTAMAITKAMGGKITKKD